MKRIGVGLAGLAVLSVAGCGSMHPGSAVVVDDDAVSVEKVDSLAQDLCEAAAASGQSEMSGAEVRQQAALLTLNLTAARQVAERLDLDVPESAYAVSSADRANFREQFPDADQDALLRIVETGNESTALLTEIGEHESDSSASEQQAQQAGQKYLQGYIADTDVDVDPRYKLDDTGQPVDADTLSVLTSENDEGSAVPATQCPS